jgi:hypothetical protein
MALNLQHQTPAQFAAYLRERYRNAKRDDVARLAKWILDHLEAGDFTDLQFRTAFGLTSGQWTTLKAKMTTLRTNYEAVQAAAGE